MKTILLIILLFLIGCNGNIDDNDQLLKKGEFVTAKVNGDTLMIISNYGNDLYKFRDKHYNTIQMRGYEVKKINYKGKVE